MRRGKRALVKHGSRSWGRGWGNLSLSDFARALFVACFLTVVMLGALALRMAGLAIRDMITEAAVSVNLDAE